MKNFAYWSRVGLCNNQIKSSDKEKKKREGRKCLFVSQNDNLARVSYKCRNSLFDNECRYIKSRFLLNR